VRVVLKKPFSDGTVAVDMDPLSLLCRLAATVPPRRFHTVRYAGVLSSHAKWRPLVVPKPQAMTDEVARADEPDDTTPSCKGTSRYRPWAELLRRTFGIDVETCPKCGGRVRLLALVTEPKNVARFLRHLGEPTDLPRRAPARDPPYWQSRVLRRRHDARSAQMGLFEEHCANERGGLHHLRKQRVPADLRPTSRARTSTQPRNRRRRVLATDGRPPPSPSAKFRARLNALRAGVRP
jgi:hypothetical protein